VKPRIGRLLDDNDDRQPDPQAILIGYDLWRSRFGAEPSIVGRRVSLAGRRFELAGVMPPGFDFPRGANVWATRDWSSQLAVPNYGRLAPGSRSSS